jgi:hypothetical protein
MVPELWIALEPACTWYLFSLSVDSSGDYSTLAIEWLPGYCTICTILKLFLYDQSGDNCANCTRKLTANEGVFGDKIERLSVLLHRLLVEETGRVSAVQLGTRIYCQMSGLPAFDSALLVLVRASCSIEITGSRRVTIVYTSPTKIAFRTLMEANQAEIPYYFL